MVETATECGVTWWVTMQQGGNPLLVASANELQLKSMCNEDGYPRMIDCAQRKKMEI